MSSTTEYIDGAASVQRLWHGPMEENADGTTSMCMLEWLDEKNGTDHYAFYKGNGKNSWFPGVYDDRANKPARFFMEGELMELPTVAVSLPYFRNIVDEFDLKLKELAVDQCAKCLKLRAELCNARATKKVAVVEKKEEELDLHRRQADKGYVHRAMLTVMCVAQWAEITLAPAGEGGQPAYQSYPTKTDFCQCDMGGGCRTPAIRAGPQYYLRTKPSKPEYICSVARGDCAFWWDETIAGFGGEEICSVHYLFDTTRPTGAGTRVLWVDGTAAQSWNRIFWCYCLDCCNPFSPTFVDEEVKSLYK